MTRQTFGRILILMGVVVWIPYFAMRLSGAAVEATTFLPFHLMLVIPGFLFARGETIRKKINAWLNRVDDTAEHGGVE